MFAKLQSWQREWLLGTVLFLLTCVVYLPVLHGVFVWDDSYMITDNQSLRGLNGLHTLWFTNKFADPYRITMTSFWLEWQLWELKPMGYHIVNVITHALGVILLWRVLKKLALPGAWLAAAIFAVHPVGAASVAWISEQKNTWSIIFYLLTILWYLRFEISGQKISYAFALFLYVCALMSKGSVVMLPVVLFLIHWWQNSNTRSRPSTLGFRHLLLLAPFFALSAAAAYMTIWFQNHKAIGGESVQDLSLIGRIATSAWAVWFYLWKGLVPVNICTIYPRWSPDPASAIVWLPMVALLAALYVCWHFRKSWGRHAFFALAYVVASIFPVMGFFNMYFLIFSRVADHWQYLALIGTVAGVVCGCVYGFQKLVEKNKVPQQAGPVLAVLLIGFLAWSTWLRAEVYANELNLWSDTVKKNPEAWMAYNNLGNALGNAHRPEEAIAAYEAAIKINPGFPDAHSNLGNSLVGKKQLDKAIEHFKIAVAGQPKMASFHFNYGIALFDQGKYQDAVNEYNIALSLNPGYADVRNNLANVYLKQDKYKEALEQALIASQIKPTAPEPHMNAAMALSSLGRTAEAAQQFDEAIRLNPDAYSVHHEYGLMLAMQGKLAEALPHFQQLIRLHPEDAAAHSNLGNAFAGLKRLDEAIAAYQAALRLQPDDAQTHNNLANVLMEQGKTDEAVQHYLISIKNRPDDPESHLNYSIALTRKGDLAEAIVQCREALRLNPNNPHIQRQLQVLTNAAP